MGSHFGGKVENVTSSKLYDSACVASDETDALCHARDVVFPVMFVFDRNVSFESLGLQLIEHVCDIADARSVGYVVAGSPHLIEILEVRANDSTLENLQTFYRIEP